MHRSYDRWGTLFPNAAKERQVRGFRYRLI